MTNDNMDTIIDAACDAIRKQDRAIGDDVTALRSINVEVDLADDGQVSCSVCWVERRGARRRDALASGMEVALIGRLPRDAGSVGSTQTGAPMLAFSVAVVDGAAGKVAPTQWARILAFGPLAEQLDGTLMEGDRVYVEGKVRLTTWPPPEGEPRPTLSVIASHIHVLGLIGRQAPRRDGRRRHQAAQTSEQPRRMPEARAIRPGRNTRAVLGLDDDLDDI